MSPAHVPLSPDTPTSDNLSDWGLPSWIHRNSLTDFQGLCTVAYMTNITKELRDISHGAYRSDVYDHMIAGVQAGLTTDLKFTNEGDFSFTLGEWDIQFQAYQGNRFTVTSTDRPPEVFVFALAGLPRQLLNALRAAGLVKVPSDASESFCLAVKGMLAEASTPATKRRR